MPTEYTIKLKSGDQIKLSAERIESVWPSLRMFDADDNLIAAWFGDEVVSVFPSSALVTPADSAEEPGLGE